MKKSKIDKEMKIKWWKGVFFEDDLIELAISKAYKDLMRTIRGFANNKNHDEIKKNAIMSIRENVSKIINSNITNQEQFDKLHEKACMDLIDKFKGQFFTVGQAQKWINMTFKYLFLLEYEEVEKVYEYCHIPVDSYILKNGSKKISKAWSKLNDYKEYNEYQSWFRNKHSDKIPLDEEFDLWLKEAKSKRKVY